MKQAVKCKSFLFAVKRVKQCVFLLTCLAIMLGLVACVTPQEDNNPEISYDLAYDLGNYDHFADIFDEKTVDQWTSMGRYTLLLKGLHTPVLLEMDGMNVLSVNAYGQTVELGEGGFVSQDCTPVSIQSAKNTVVVNLTWDYDGETIILTNKQRYEFRRDGDISTQVFLKDDGTLRYTRYWGEYRTSFEQWDTAPLDLCTSRDHFLEESGRAEIVGGEVVLTAENTATVSDKYDLDAMFAEAKAAGMYQEYETVDALLAANQAKADLS